MSITKDEMIEALQKASKLGYFGGMGSGPNSATSTTEASTATAKFGSILGNAADAAKGFGSAALQVGSAVAIGGARLNDVTQALSAGFKGLGTNGDLLGIALSKGADALNYLGKNIDENVDTFRKLSDTGLAFGNDIMAMKEQASGARLSIAEFGEVMQKNNATMIGFGATSAASAKQLSKMSDEFFKSGLGEQLRGMGYTTKELNDVLAVSISGQKIKDLNESGVSARALKAASSLAFEMDAIAKITGKSKEAQLDELRKTQADGQIISARNLMIAEGGEKTAEAFQAVSTAAGYGGDEMRKFTLAYLTGAVLSTEQMQTFALLSDGARESLDAAKEATKRGADNDIAIAKQKTEMFLAQSAMDIRNKDRAQMIGTAQFETQARIVGQTEKFAESMKFAAKELGPNADATAVATLGFKRLAEQLAIEQKAGGKDDPNAAAGASITRFAIDMESRGRDLTDVLYNQVTKPLATDVAKTIVTISETLKLSDAMLMQTLIGDPMKKGFDKARINREVKEESLEPKPGSVIGNAGDPLNLALHKDFLEFNTLITGSHAQSEATIKVLERIAAERTKETGKTVTANQVAVEATNKPGGLAEIVKQIKKELPPAEQNTTPPVLPPGTIDPTRSGPTAEKIGAGVEALGAMFRTGTAKVVVTNMPNYTPPVAPAPTPPVAPAPTPPVMPPGVIPPRASGSLEMAGKMFEDWGKGTMVELHGLESVMRPQDISNVIESAMGGVRKTMPKIDMAGAENTNSKIDLSGISKSISTSISSVSGGGSTTTSRVQNDDSKKAQKELRDLEESQVAERKKLVDQLKEEGVIKGRFANSGDYKNIPQLAALKEKQDSEKSVLSKRVDAGTSYETVREEAKAETTKLISEQIAITKTSNKDKLATTKQDIESLDEMYKSKSKDKLATTKQDIESLDEMYKDDSKAKLDLAKQRNAALFKEAELAKDVVGTSVKGMSDSMLESMIPKGSKIENYYIDMNDKLQSYSVDAVAKIEKDAKERSIAEERYANYKIELQKRTALEMEKIDKEGAITTIAEEEAIVKARVAIKKTEKQMAAAESLGIDSSMLDMKPAMPDMNTIFKDIAGKMPKTEELNALMPKPEAISGIFSKLFNNIPKPEELNALMPKPEAISGIFSKLFNTVPKSISTSISSVTGPDSTAIKQPQAEVKTEEPASTWKGQTDEFGGMESPSALKSKAMSTSDMMAGGLTLGANGMPIMKSIDTAKNSIPATKSVDADTAREDAKFKRAAEEKKAETVKMAQEKPDTKAATKESTLSDVVAQLNSLNKQMGQLIAVNEDGHKSTTNAARSGASNVYAR